MSAHWPSMRLVSLVLILTGCTRGCGGGRESLPPEKVVEAYLNTALNMRDISGRDQLLQYTTGRLKEAIASASDDTIKGAYVNRHYDLESYSVIERRDRTPRETEITFRLRYHDLGSGEVRSTNINEAPMVQTENTVALIREKSTWYIRDVVGAKTTIDFPVSEESKITAKPGPGIDEPEATAPTP